MVVWRGASGRPWEKKEAVTKGRVWCRVGAQASGWIWEFAEEGCDGGI